MALFNIPGGLIVFFVGFYLLSLHLAHYVIFWCISFATDFVCLWFLLFFLPESMPDQLRQPITIWDLNPLKYYVHAIKIICKYPLLIGIGESSRINCFVAGLSLTEHCVCQQCRASWAARSPARVWAPSPEISSGWDLSSSNRRRL